MTAPMASALALLACPVCWSPLAVDQHKGEPVVICIVCARRYPIVDGIPVLIPDRALD